jgi:hypothetical protein
LEYSLSSLLLRYLFNFSTGGQSGANIENAKGQSSLGAGSSNRPPAPLVEPERPVQNGIDRTVIALWLGHESVERTQTYVHADMQLKKKAMAKIKPVAAPPGRYGPNDQFAFLEALRLCRHHVLLAHHLRGLA